MSWAQKRQLSFLGGVILLLVIILAVFAWRLNPAPSCTDYTQNQDEVGVDCGGVCPNLCLSEVTSLNILWARPFEVLPEIYDAVAYVENINLGSGIKDIFYSFKFYDDENILIAERNGKTFIAPDERLAVFENGIDVGKRIPKRAFFEFVQEPKWVKINSINKQGIKVYIKNEKLETQPLPRLTATFFNDSVYDIDNIDFTAVLYDQNDNAFAVSSTNINRMLKTSSQEITFTWPRALTATSSRIEILPRVNPFNIK